STETDPFGAETARDARISGGISIGAHPEAPHVVCPCEQSREGLVGRCVLRLSHAANDLYDLARRGREISLVHLAAGAVDGDVIALGDRDVADRELPLLEIDVH